MDVMTYIAIGIGVTLLSAFIGEFLRHYQGFKRAQQHFKYIGEDGTPGRRREIDVRGTALFGEAPDHTIFRPSIRTSLQMSSFTPFEGLAEQRVYLVRSKSQTKVAAKIAVTDSGPRSLARVAPLSVTLPTVFLKRQWLIKPADRNPVV